MTMQGAYARLIELRTRNQIKEQPVGDTGLVKDMDKVKDEFTTDQEDAE